MGRHFLYILTLICLSSNEVRHIRGEQSGLVVTGNSPANNSSENADGQGTTKGDVPTAEQILGKLLGMKPKNPDQTQDTQPAQVAQTAPQTVALPGGAQVSTSLARSPIRSQQPQTVINNLPLVPTTGRSLPTPQTEDNQGTIQQLSPHYGRGRHSRHRYDDDDDGGADDEDRGDNGDERDDDEDDHNPADDDYHDSVDDHRHGHRRWRGRGRQLGGRFGRREGGCGCVCWKGIKPHVEWVRVPVCYHPCGVCCPKHEEQPACACICHPCCNHCCCCHHCCHCCRPCCHCCHCCRRNQVRWNPPLAPRKPKYRTIHKKIEKKTKRA